MLLLTLLACAKEASEDPYVVPDDVTTGLYAVDGGLTVFPDDLNTEPADTPTGLQVRFRDSVRDDLALQVPPEFTLVEALEELDGFGTSAGLMFRFSAPLDPDSVTPETVVLTALDDEAVAAPLGWEAEWTDEGATLILTPLFPLAPSARYGVAMAGLVDAEGEAVWASVDTRALTAGDPDGVLDADVSEALSPRYEALLDATGFMAEEVQAATVFTTQSLFEEDDAAAAIIAGEDYALTPGDCVEDGEILTCSMTLEVLDFLGDDSVLGEVSPQGAYVLPVDLHLPVGLDGPFPVMIYGHGLSGDKGEARGVARNLASVGMAVAAIDAPAHGEHPAGVNDLELFWVFEFFGIDPDTFGFEVRTLRDSWRRAAWDKLQLAAALRAEVDADGDGVGEIDGARVVFGGHSLGATMGPHLMRLDPEIRAAELATPGGRVTNIVHRGEIFAPLILLMAPDGAEQSDVDRFFPLLQAAVERGDGVNHAVGLLDGSRDVLMTQVIDDAIIPNSCTRALARAMGVEHAPPILQVVDGLDESGGLPLSGNLDGRTAALYQYDEMVKDGTLQDATHERIHSSESGIDQYLHFWESWLETGTAEIVDPFAVD